VGQIKEYQKSNYPIQGHGVLLDTCPVHLRDRPPVTPTGSSESPVNLHVVGLWEEPENTEGTHAAPGEPADSKQKNHRDLNPLFIVFVLSTHKNGQIIAIYTKPRDFIS